MGDRWMTAMPESSLENQDISCNSSQFTIYPSMYPTQFAVHSSIPFSKNSYSILSAFCSEENISQCISYINQEVSSLGFPAICTECSGQPELNMVSVLNTVYELLQLHRRSQRTLENLETEQFKYSSNLEHLQLSNSKLKDQLEHSKRENTGLFERERQLQMKIKSLQNSLKNEKEEVQKLQNIISSRATQYNHDMKRKEREYTKLKERLNQLLIDKKDKKLAIEVLNYVGRSDGKRSLWKTGKTEARNEEEMYQTLLKNYESRQKDLMVENAELKKVLQQMKKEMVSILSSRKHSLKGETIEESLEQTASDNEEDVCDSSRETLELSCEHAREQLTNSIRQQWRLLKDHMEKLNSQASLVQNGKWVDNDVIPRKAHEEEMDKLKLEIQQCKDFIQTQQQLWQQQLSSPCDDETAALLNDCYMLEEKERLKEEWRLFDEQRRNFEKERKNFTEAAIRLGRERKAFEEDRATWLKHQFLNMTPFIDRPESEMKIVSTPGQLKKSLSHTSFSTPKATPVKMPSTTDLHRTLRLIPEHRSFKTQPKMGNLQDSILSSDISDKTRVLKAGNCSIYTLSDAENSPK
ncbi:synovial sarcoma, X breakpoint 2 interacting protein a isoform X3 [Scleropages formosus]|uniref:synovial sarcoma, X breakpoint 2 interacting protein a isoform X3 n=1 Tax=Scleropages formosus TaxID=113540 RepID=UPI0008782E6D|nr:afadin- and alpha-actinin-binding protein isoform X3 [Scleropages formosus]